MLFYKSPSTDPYFNLALEERLLTAPPDGDDVFMLWQNADTAVVGYYQNTAEEVDTAFAAENGISVVRRITGGGAVYHDLGNVNFSFICAVPTPETLDLAAFSKKLAAALCSMRLGVEVSGRNDLTIGGKKISGSAQTYRYGRVLHHGTLLYNTDLARMQRVLDVSAEKLASKGVQSVSSRVTNICGHMAEAMDVETFMYRLAGHILSGQLPGQLELSAAELREVEKLQTEKYKSWDWNFGGSPGYSVRKQRRFDAGGVTVEFEALRGNVLGAIAFSGDFFGSGDIGELERALVGVPLRRRPLIVALSDADSSRFIAGVSPRELAELILG